MNASIFSVNKLRPVWRIYCRKTYWEIAGSDLYVILKLLNYKTFRSSQQYAHRNTINIRYGSLCNFIYTGTISAKIRYRYLLFYSTVTANKYAPSLFSCLSIITVELLSIIKLRQLVLVYYSLRLIIILYEWNQVKGSR
jgi:hypothetical protein